MSEEVVDNKVRKHKRLNRLFWTFVLVSILGIVGLFGGISKGYLGMLPTFDELENPKSNLATEIFSSDQELLGKYFRENRTKVEYDELSPHIIDALICTEDERYREHSGIDVIGLTRAIINLGAKGGASTITQQLSKMLFHARPASNMKRVLQKLKEWVISIQLEQRYTKDEIITMYLNKFDFVNNAVGIKSASNVYYGKDPIELDILQSAMLVGMAKNPALFNPIRRPDTTIHRRNVVLAQLMRNDKITKLEFDSLKVLPLDLMYSVVDHKEGIAPYFREVLRSEVKKLFQEKNAAGNYKLAKPNGDPYDIYSDGLKIYTTINADMQRYAEWAVRQHMSWDLQKDFFRDLKRRGKKKPFDWRLTDLEIDRIMKTAMKRTLMYRVLSGKECGKCHRRGKIIEHVEDESGSYYQCTADDCKTRKEAISPDSVRAVFETPKPMRVFSYKGDIDTILSPMDSIRYYKSYLQTGMMSMDPHTGYIKAWVGGIDYKHFRFDHVQQSKRQVGSTFKPFVYCLAIQNGYSPCHEVPNHQIIFEKEKWGMEEDWSPKNSDDDYGGMISLKYGLANSMNTITSWVLKQFGPRAPQNVIDLARKMGIKSHIDPVPSICLGVADLSVFEMVGANATFANKGVWIEPTFITRIEDKNGNVIKDFVPEKVEAMSEEMAYIMLNLMKGVTSGVTNRHTGKRIGTGIRIRYESERRPYGGIKYPIAGKTGTTQNNSDGWFMGITPDLVTGVWVGAEDRGVRFSRTSLGQGANTSLPIWAYYMKKIYADSTLEISTGDFEAPENPLKVELDCEKFYRSKKSNTFEGDPDFSE